MASLGGKPRSYTPDEFAEKAIDYFEWVSDKKCPAAMLSR